MEEPQLQKLISIIQSLQNRLLSAFGSSQTSILDQKEISEFCNASLTFSRENNLTEESQEHFIEWYEAKLENYIRTLILPQLKQKSGEALLDDVLKHADDFEIFVSAMKKALVWLDPTAFRNFGKEFLSEISYIKFRREVFDFMAPKILNPISDFLEKEREKNFVPRKKIKRVIEIAYAYESLGRAGVVQGEESKVNEISQESSEDKNEYFVKLLEANMLEKLRLYYKAKSEQWLQLPVSISEYITAAANALRFEADQCDFYFPKCKSLVLKTMIQEMFEAHKEHLFKYHDSNMFKLFTEKKYVELSGLYDILLPGDPDGLSFLSQALASYIESTGETIFAEAEVNKDPTMFATRIIALAKEMDKVLSDCFKSNGGIKQALDQGFKSLFNKFKRILFHLNRYVDFQFVRGTKGKGDKEIEEMLVDFIRILKYSSAFDVFLEGYNSLLCKRLLNRNTLFFDSEESFVAKLSEVYGKGPLYRTQHILRGAIRSEEYNREFSQIYPHNPIRVLYCGSASWQNLRPNLRHNLPSDLVQFTKEFELFHFQSYLTEFSTEINFSTGGLTRKSRRTLFWIFHEGKAEMLAKFGQKKYTLEMRPYQMSILLRFNENPEYTFGQLVKLTGIDTETLYEYLIIIINQVPILKRGDAAKKEEMFADDEVITVNEEFSAETKRINCSPKNQFPEKKQQDEEGLKKTAFDSERKHCLDAMVVKVMKLHRVMRVDDLLAYLTKIATLFQPEPEMLEISIDSLVRIQFLERDKVHPNILIYIP